MYSISSELTKLKELGVKVSARMQVLGAGRFAKQAILETQSDLPFETDGLFLQVDKKTSLSMAIVAEALDNPRLAVVLVERVKDQNAKVTRLTPVKTEGGKNFFVRLVSTWELVNGSGHSTKPLDNSLRVVSVEDNFLRVISAGIPSRLRREKKTADHFLVVQEMYSAKLYRDKAGKIVVEDDIVTANEEYPGFNKWESMRELVGEMIPLAERKKLPLLKSRKKAVSKPLLKLGQNEAEVIFFDINKGFGFARVARVADGRGIYFNWQNSASKDRLPYFFAGQKVVYDEIRNNDRGEQLVGVRAV